MIKNLTQFLGYDTFAELAVVLFSAIFLVVAWRTLRMHSDVTQRHARVVLDDEPTGEIGGARYE